MKRNFKNLGPLPAAIVVTIVLAIAQSCASSPAKVAYTTIGVTKQAVDLAMRTWADYVVAGHATQAQEDNVRNAHDKYRGVARALGATLEATNSSPTPAALADAAKEIVSLVEQFTGKKIGSSFPDREEYRITLIPVALPALGGAQ